MCTSVISRVALQFPMQRSILMASHSMRDPFASVYVCPAVAVGSCKDNTSARCICTFMVCVCALFVNQLVCFNALDAFTFA